MRALALAASAGVLVAAAVFVPLPLLELEPGPVYESDAVVSIEGAQTESRYLVTTVAVGEPSLVDALQAIFDGERELVGRGSVLPPGVHDEEWVRLQLRMFDESVRLAVAVGLQAAGHEVIIEGQGAVVLAVAAGVPADGVLELGDVIVDIGGRPIRLAADVSAALGGYEVGDEVQLTVLRDGEEVVDTVELDRIDELDRPGLGVLLRTADRLIGLPDGVQIASVGVGGQSAGLMIAVAVYDQATEGSLAGDRVVAGTGTIDAEGRVGPIGGVDQKVSAAVAAGADVFLVAEVHADDARAAAGDAMTVIGVASLDDAISALRE